MIYFLESTSGRDAAFIIWVAITITCAVMIWILSYMIRKLDELKRVVKIIKSKVLFFGHKLLDYTNDLLDSVSEDLTTEEKELVEAYMCDVIGELTKSVSNMITLHKLILYQFRHKTMDNYIIDNLTPNFKKKFKDLPDRFKTTYLGTNT